MEAPILFRLVVTIAILPWFIWLARRVRGARDFMPLAVAFYLVCGATLATVLERSLGLEFMDAVQHTLYALAGAMSLIGIYTVRRDVYRRKAAT